jgi:hypothetical protein
LHIRITPLSTRILANTARILGDFVVVLWAAGDFTIQDCVNAVLNAIQVG